MSLFDEIFINARTAANTVGKKAGQLKDYSKLKYSESGIKADIAKKKQELGDYIYSCSKTGEIDKVKMQSFVEEIDELEENLQITKEMLTVAKNKVTCSACKAENERDSSFCCKCGQKLTEEQKNTECNCCCEEDNCDVTVAASSAVEDVTSEAVGEDITVAEKEDSVVVEESKEVAEEATAKPEQNDVTE
ncbi:MAG: hypothetical protein U0M12_08520 [Acutalibacteraceae bacterium]|nr:hypothetical protein [Acutalibacteraceae bacterium]